MVKLIYSEADWLSEFYTIMVNNLEVVKFHYYFDEWSMWTRSSNQWVELEGPVNPLKIAKSIARDFHQKELQFCTLTCIGVIRSRINV